MKLSINEAKLTGLWAGNCAAIQQVWILKFTFGPEKFPGLSRNGPQTQRHITLLFIVLFAISCTKQKKSNYLNSHGEEAQEKPPGL